MGNILEKMSRLSLSNGSTLNDSKGSTKTVNNSILNTPSRNFIADQILDPRSATLGIKRTPLILTKVNETPKDETPIKAIPYLETDLDEVIEAETSKPCFHSEINISSNVDSYLTQESDSAESLSIGDTSVFNEEEKDEEVSTTEPNADLHFDDEIVNAEDKILQMCNSPVVTKLRKTFIYEDDESTPTSESTPVKLKGGRTPLSLMSTNSSPLPSPLGMKPWRGIQEERMRLGLENTPPGPQPFLESVQSAPGKVGARRAKKLLGRENWAQDESLVI